MANLKDLIVNGSARILGNLYAPNIKDTPRITEFIVGTQTAATGSWTGKTQDTSLYDGKNINYFLPYAGSGNASLNLTLSDGTTTTGAKPVYLWGTSYVTTHYPVNSCINMTYNASKGAWFVNADRDNNDNTFDRIKIPNNVHASGACTAGKIICGNSSGYKDVASGVTFDIDYPLLYCATAIASGNNGTNNYLTIPSINLQTTKASWTGTQWASVYLVGTISGKTVTIDSSIFTTTVPTTADSKVYIPIGVLYSTYQLHFISSQQMYAYRNGKFQQIQPDLSGYVPTGRTVNGKALSSNISLTASDVGALSSHQTIKVNGVTGATTNNYGTCSTAAGTAEKAVALTSGTFNLETGARVLVKFTVTNTAANPTLNVASKGAKAIQYRGSAISAGYLSANRTYEFVYDGSVFQLIGDLDTNSNTTYSAGTDLSLSGTTFNHKASGVTAGTIGTSAATSGSTLAVPYVTYNTQGHITATGTHTHTVTGFQLTSTAVTHAANTAVGSVSQPVYIASNGTATACNMNYQPITNPSQQMTGDVTINFDQKNTIKFVSPSDNVTSVTLTGFVDNTYSANTFELVVVAGNTEKSVQWRDEDNSKGTVIKWQEGSAPSFPANTHTLLVLRRMRYSGGAIWLGNVQMQWS